MIKHLKLYLTMVLMLGMAANASAASGRYYQGSNRPEFSRRVMGNCGQPYDCQVCAADGMVTIYRSSPSVVSLGKEFTVKLTARASGDCTDVVIKEMMPEGLTYVSSDPAAKVDGRELSWGLGTMCCNQCKQLCITYRASECGCHQNCYSVVANPVCCQCVKVGCPQLCITKCGTQCTRICCPVYYRITVKNEGTMTARDVVVTDYVPEELRHRSGRKQLCWRLGDLRPCESRAIDVCFTAGTCGIACNTVTAQACGCPACTATASTSIEACCVSVTKTGPKGPVTVGQEAEYRITAHNDGNIALTNVRLVDTVPSGTRIKSASGAEVSGRTATWTIPNFEAGAEKSFDITITSCVAGCLTNQVCAMCNQECGDCAYATTRWEGVPGIWMEVKSGGPVCVGNHTDYCIVLMNQGFADDTNVHVKVTFPGELEPQKANGFSKGKIDGRTVTFDKLPVLRPGQTVNYCISAKAVDSGLAHVRVEVTSDTQKEAYVKTETTNVF
jgi:uncharacterized repeat protein (TIGR01451 family)